MIKYKDITKKQNTETAIVFALIAILGGLYFKISEFNYIAVTILFTILLFPTLIKPVAFFWWNLSMVLSWLSSKIILTILFFFLVTPIALIRRAMGKDSLRLKAFKHDQTSAFVERNQTITDADLKYPF